MARGPSPGPGVFPVGRYPPRATRPERVDRTPSPGDIPDGRKTAEAPLSVPERRAYPTIGARRSPFVASRMRASSAAGPALPSQPRGVLRAPAARRSRAAARATQSVRRASSRKRKRGARRARARALPKIGHIATPRHTAAHFGRALRTRPGLSITPRKKSRCKGSLAGNAGRTLLNLCIDYENASELEKRPGLPDSPGRGLISCTRGCAMVWDKEALPKEVAPAARLVLPERRWDAATALESSTRLVATVREWGEQWLDMREREGVRSIRTDRSRWRTHVESAPWIDRPLRSVSRADARGWLAALSTRRRANPRHKNPPLIAHQTMKNALHLVRVAFEDALDAGLCDDNPFAGLKVRRSRAARTREAWTVLRPAEQAAVISAVRTPERWMVAFALGSCLRRGEQWALRLSDLKLEGERPYVVVRFGGFPDLPTKSGKPRRLPLFGLALDALRRWMAALPTYAPRNPHGLVFPRRNGLPRRHTPAKLMARMRKQLGRHFRWHDLRHSGATSLYSGWWGAPWPLEKVQRLCGHASIHVTQRYAHWVDEDQGLERVARATEATMVENESTDELRWSRGGSNP